jgi:hypothetical protein
VNNLFSRALALIGLASALYVSARRLQVTPKPAEPRIAPQSFMAHNQDVLIQDGVDYSQPMILPLERREQLRQSGKLQEALDGYHNQFSNPYRTADDMPFMPTSEDPLWEWDAMTRERVLSNCHAAYNRNPLANAAVNFTTDFVIGSGFNLVCKNPDVERVLKAFIDNPDNAVRKYERQAVNDLQVDGELVLRFFGKGEQLVMVPQRPWELKWIKTEKGFFRRPLVYHFERFETEGDSPTGGSNTKSEDVPAKDIHFVAINDHAYELRGRPELYRILPWLKADKEWLEDRSRQNKWRNALLWHVKVANATAPILANVVGKWRRPPSPGSAYVSSAFEEVNALTNPVGGADAGHDGRAIRLMVVLGLRLPEYFFGDGKQANLATATRQELPALTKFESFQQILIEQLWIPVFKRVLEDAGLPPEVDEYDTSGKVVYEPEAEDAPDELPEPQTTPKRTQKTIALTDAFDVSYKPVAQQDLTALATMLGLATDKGWASNQTASEKLGFDTAIEQDRIEREQRETLKRQAQGLEPIPPDAMPPDTGDEEEKQPAR